MYWTCPWDHLSNAATSLLGSLYTLRVLSSWLGVICWVWRDIGENALSSILGWGGHHFKLCKGALAFSDCFYFIFFLTVHHVLSIVKSNFMSIQCDMVKVTWHLTHMGFQLLKAIPEFICLFVLPVFVFYLEQWFLRAQYKTKQTWLGFPQTPLWTVLWGTGTSIGQFYLKRGK